MRSRTGSLPRSRWRSMEGSSPPAPRPGDDVLAGAEVGDEARTSRRGWRASPGRRGPAGCAGRAWRARIVPRRGNRRPASVVRRPCRPTVRRPASSSSSLADRPASSAWRRSGAPIPVRRRATGPAPDRRDARRRVLRGPCGSTVDRRARRTVHSAAKPPRPTSGGSRPTQLARARRGDQDDRLRGPQESPVHRRVPRELRRPGVHLRVRGPGGHRTDRTCEVEVDSGLAALRRGRRRRSAVRADRRLT